ncbi:hypothetical protein BOX15_Mlig019237g1 [Macrostomum lignano]|uniref:Uncharacterized protein n=1 Tax=Macrostomum lignano TaxID=282301 RepID=A0A267G074_9PLAT|nr:hypothetical protein BOX15_Mlig019237g1 [Macrostomum lignano]
MLKFYREYPESDTFTEDELRYLLSNPKQVQLKRFIKQLNGKFRATSVLAALNQCPKWATAAKGKLRQKYQNADLKIDELKDLLSASDENMLAKFIAQIDNRGIPAKNVIAELREQRKKLIEDLLAATTNFPHQLWTELQGVLHLELEQFDAAKEKFELLDSKLPHRRELIADSIMSKLEHPETQSEAKRDGLLECLRLKCKDAGQQVLEFLQGLRNDPKLHHRNQYELVARLLNLRKSSTSFFIKKRLLYKKLQSSDEEFDLAMQDSYEKAVNEAEVKFRDVCQKVKEEFDLNPYPRQALLSATRNHLIADRQQEKKFLKQTLENSHRALDHAWKNFIYSAKKCRLPRYFPFAYKRRQDADTGAFIKPRDQLKHYNRNPSELTIEKVTEYFENNFESTVNMDQKLIDYFVRREFNILTEEGAWIIQWVSSVNEEKHRLQVNIDELERSVNELLTATEAPKSVYELAHKATEFVEETRLVLHRENENSDGRNPNGSPGGGAGRRRRGGSHSILRGEDAGESDLEGSHFDPRGGGAGGRGRGGSQFDPRGGGAGGRGRGGSHFDPRGGGAGGRGRGGSHSVLQSVGAGGRGRGGSHFDPRGGGAGARGSHSVPRGGGAGGRGRGGSQFDPRGGGAGGRGRGGSHFDPRGGGAGGRGRGGSHSVLQSVGAGGRGRGGSHFDPRGGGAGGRGRGGSQFDPRGGGAGGRGRGGSQFDPRGGGAGGRGRGGSHSILQSVGAGGRGRGGSHSILQSVGAGGRGRGGSHSVPRGGGAGARGSHSVPRGGGAGGRGRGGSHSILQSVGAGGRGRGGSHSILQSVGAGGRGRGGSHSVPRGRGAGARGSHSVPRGGGAGGRGRGGSHFDQRGGGAGGRGRGGNHSILRGGGAGDSGRGGSHSVPRGGGAGDSGRGGSHSVPRGGGAGDSGRGGSHSVPRGGGAGDSGRGGSHSVPRGGGAGDSGRGGSHSVPRGGGAGDSGRGGSHSVPRGGGAGDSGRGRESQRPHSRRP